MAKAKKEEPKVLYKYAVLIKRTNMRGNTYVARVVTQAESPEQAAKLFSEHLGVEVSTDDIIDVAKEIEENREIIKKISTPDDIAGEESKVDIPEDIKKRGGDIGKPGEEVYREVYNESKEALSRGE